jgi:lysophospholipase L1-like esterase
MLKEFARTAGAILFVLVLLEALLRISYFFRNSFVDVVPLPYVIGHDYGPIPPWGEDLRILEPDSELIWRNRANVKRKYLDVFSPCDRPEDRTALLRQFIPSIPASLKDNPVWEISLNSNGFRNREIKVEKPPQVYRIVCMGDSWTFGVNVREDQTYPRQLAAWLEREYPDSRFEVVNLGVLGYSSYQGLELLRRYAIHLDPDLLVIGFGMNDASVAGYRDRDIPETGGEGDAEKKGDSALDRIEIYKMLRYIALLVKYDPPDPGRQIQSIAEKSHGAETEEEYGELEPWTRVSLADYESNIVRMIEMAEERSAGAILLFNELWPESPYQKVLERISRENGIPLIDSSALVAKAKCGIEAELERRLDLRPENNGTSPNHGDVEVVFRVYSADRPVPSSIYIVGDHPQLGGLRPNEIVMYDDGTHGDQRPGDNIWSFTATFEPGIKVPYVYTNSGTPGEWEGLDIPDVRKFALDPDEERTRIYRPIDTFGEVYMQADSWHTNAEGYRLIAEAIFEALERNGNIPTHEETHIGVRP